MRQEFKIMRDLDHKVQEIVNEAQTKTDELLQFAKSLPKEERIKRVREIQRLYKKGVEISNDKVSRAENVYELVDKQIRRLDADMFEFKKSLAEKELKKTQKKSDSNVSPRSVQLQPISSGCTSIPATAALALALTNNPGEVLDMPVDPNEPTYCLCQQVSFGEMVACDNRDCPIEWFHFGCVGLTSKPRGHWYCPNCSNSAPRNKDE
ncbi:unnamed protein product [Mesocestoides corti]|uniref:Inhibitor of growth protein n=1 Tax=Mesocestoides corti TaxID=53468 RepID=A0A3P6HZW7_MESCO|nr:unnamed protein product [Mesocestoides corti]